MVDQVELIASGLLVGGRFVPLLSGSIHYWRLDPIYWRKSIRALKSLGMRLVDTYIPWGVHELAPKQFDFGQQDPKRDIIAFLNIIQEEGLLAIVRPGPHINAELTHFGLPERLIWSRACQARSPKQNPVVLPMLPVAFPVPSYASKEFLKETDTYFQALGPIVAPNIYPRGPIVLLQIDNEGALYFRDSPYDQDYHPDAIELYRAFLKNRYQSPENLGVSYGQVDSFDLIVPPTSFNAKQAEDLAKHLDWVAFQEYLLCWSLQEMKQSLERAGICGIPTVHNLPPGQDATPLNAAKLSQVVDLVGLDYYHQARPLDRTLIARRTSELSDRCWATQKPAFACEMGAGFPPFFPVLSEQDSEFTLLCALAYGLHGFNLYMAVGRDRWIGGPINDHGEKRSSSRFYEQLTQAIERVNFVKLHRKTPVKIMVPRSLRRLTRAMHAFGPLTPTLFSVLGSGAAERCFEHDFGLGGPVAIEGDQFLKAFETALDERGVPFAWIGGEDAPSLLDSASWVICATTGGIEPKLFEAFARFAQRGMGVTLGPRAPTRDGSMRAIQEPFDLSRLSVGPFLSPFAADPAAIDQLISHAIETFSLPTFACEPDTVYATVHHNDSNEPKVAFLINPTDQDLNARVSIQGVCEAIDVLGGPRCEVATGVIRSRLPPKTVRFLALS